MENYDPYRYPYPPPENSNSGPPPPYNPYQYDPHHSFPSQPYPPPYQSYSGPLDHRPSHHSGPLFQSPPLYPYPSLNSPSFSYPNSNYAPPPQPSLQYHGSFQYSSSFQYSQQGSFPSDVYPPAKPLSRMNSSPDYRSQESSVSSNHGESGSSSLYPLENLMATVRLNDQGSSGQDSPLVSNSAHGFQSQNLMYCRSELVYGYPDHSFSGHSGSSSPQSPVPPLPFVGSQQGQNLQMVPFQPSKASLKVLLLHGNLDIYIVEAKNLPNMDMFSKTLKDMFGNLPSNVGSKMEGHIPRPHSMTSDPYVSIVVSKAVLGRTYVISNSENPIWWQHFYFPVAHYAAEVCFVVKDSDIVGSQFIGTVAIPVEQIYSGAKVEGYFPILNSNGKPCKPGAVLRLSLQYIPIAKQTMYDYGVGAGPDYHGVLGTYFPLRRGGKVTLYQDAHVPEGCLPDLRLDNGMRFEHGKCWQDIFDTIRQARRLIYIVGWSVFHKVRLVRDAGYGSDCTLGDLLRTKSQDGVRVLLLIWDDPTSRKIWLLQTGGVMQTHDEETRRFFKHSSVQVLLCPRSAGKRHSWAKQQEVGAIYTHHQKTVIVDTDAGNGKRKITAFVGGLDLCDGRYDTPKHSILRTLQTVHKDDYHNPTFAGTDLSCPREPWHDLHCKIEGPAAYDVLTNFEERWLKASKPHGIKRLKKSLYDDALLKIDRIPDIVGMHDAPCLSENDPEGWHVQVFRSIDSNSVKGFPKDPKDATSKNLVCGKNVLIDMSIHTAYVKAIRAAQHFIYMENQYFLGSSYNWSKYNDLGANNLIPMEIALKIANKIKANERFSAYIVIPMWPEGDPTSVPTQRILFWQNKTMQMMYEIIYKALEEVGLEKTYVPQDYLNFFCLGNREAADGTDASCGSPASNTPQGLARRNRRFMIYVHSKGMIVDDEYVIIGSANINQRSLEGTRDTEIAMGAYQPHHTWARKLSSPHGQIYGYRMSLWAEHLGLLEDCFFHPESLECVRRVNELAKLNWRQFAAEEITEMKGHLMKYPVEVDEKGKVKSLPGCETFLDVGGIIVGTFFAIQENLTI
ncbi:phospholipase D gamma 1-like [Magnolia sinica]|uniref:phospholipase D gamma 1-like n=1 Tax=Magnolia sinica TaxID=86752 RepID=UPI002658FEF4|nr:phospholipase D gamma 1-like [Magnolia sinica]